MKKLITLMVLAWTALASAQTAEQYIAAGTNDLAANDWWSANTNFAEAVAISPTNETANALEGAMRLLVLPQTPAGSNFLVALGFPSTNRWLPHIPEAGLPTDSYNKWIFPAGYDSTNLVAFFRTNIMAAIAASQINLANIQDANFTLLLSSNETSVTDVTVDYGDIQLLRSLLASAQFIGYTFNANNCSVVLPHIVSLLETNGLTIQALLADYPNLLTMQTTNDRAASEGALTNAIALYFAASDFIRNRPADATNRLFELDTNDFSKEAAFRADLTNALLSLNGPTEFATNNYTSAINAAAWFSGTNSLRPLAPEFRGDIYVNNSLPDNTFGGILPNLPECDAEAGLRYLFHDYAGIYTGDLQDNIGYGGDFAVFVDTNQQAYLIGNDYGDGLGDGTEFSLLGQVSVDWQGNWQFDSNAVFGVSGYGSISRDGGFQGELDFTNGGVVWLNGQEESPNGSFQDSAGYYTGTTSSGQVPEILGIMTAGGEIFFCPVQADGMPQLGDSAWFDSTNHFTVVNDEDTTVAGTLDPEALTMAGTFYNPGGGSGTWSMSRSGNVPFDLPPVITTLPQDLILPAGTNATFFLTATGSPPVCYQWYFDDSRIPFATSNVLVVTNLQPGSAGTYTVSVKNAVDGTNAAATLVVLGGAGPLLNSVGYLSSSQFGLQFNAETGQLYTLQMSTNLASTNWMSLVVTNAPGGLLFLTDTNATNTDRYYRLKVGE